MSVINPGNLYKGMFSKAIMLCESKIGLLKNKPDRAEKYKNLKKAYQDAQTKLDKIIKSTKEIKLANPSDPNKQTFYDEFIAGKESFVSLCWLSTKLAEVKDAGGIASKSEAIIKDLDFKVKDVDVKYDFVDATKNVVKQVTNGTGVSKKITKGCLFVGLGELLSRGVTSAMAKQGIMKGSMGLIGLGKLGIAQLPKLWPIVQHGAQMILGLPQLALLAGGAYAVFKGIPMIKNHIDKVKKNFKNANAFDKGMDELLSQQQQTVLA